MKNEDNYGVFSKEEYLKLLKYLGYIAKRYYRFYKDIYDKGSIDYDDLFQEASIILTKALKNPIYKDKTAKDLDYMIKRMVGWKLSEIKKRLERKRETSTVIIEEEFDLENEVPSTVSRVKVEKVEFNDEHTSNYDAGFVFSDLTWILTEREYAIMKAIYVDDFSKTDVAHMFQISNARVTQIVQDLLKGKLKKYLTE